MDVFLGNGVIIFDPVCMQYLFVCFSIQSNLLEIRIILGTGVNAKSFASTMCQYLHAPFNSEISSEAPHFSTCCLYFCHRVYYVD